jgi:hypothetical protein
VKVLKERLVEIVGSANVSDDQKLLDSFAGDKSFAKAISPLFVGKPHSGEEIENCKARKRDENSPYSGEFRRSTLQGRYRPIRPRIRHCRPQRNEKSTPY